MFSFFPLLAWICCLSTLHHLKLCHSSSRGDRVWCVPQLNFFACTFSSCCQSHPQCIRCQSNTHSLSMTFTINYGWHNEYYYIALTHKHTSTRQYWQTHTDKLVTHRQTHSPAELYPRANHGGRTRENTWHFFLALRIAQCSQLEAGPRIALTLTRCSCVSLKLSSSWG